MIRQVLFIQGGGEGTHDEWDNKLVDSLTAALGPGYEIFYPRMPNEADPDYLSWKQAIAQELARLGDGAILVGHSVGAAVLLNAIATDPPQRALGGLMLLAMPFFGEGGWPSDDIGPQEKLGAELPGGLPVYIYHGNNDDTVPSAHVEHYAKAIPQAIVRRLSNRDHQLDNDLSEVGKDIKSLS
ncbi:MAG: alpha/beta hydrolase [Hoeflea sp. BRH_c9]|nr:MAG: alpha/beta hydrolase [Hoeflea sp. BRH_c9]